MRLGQIAACALTSVIVLGALPACSSTARIVDVYMALDGSGERKRSVFFADSENVFCVIEAGISRPGVTIETVFRQLQAYDRPNGKYFDTDRVYANGEFAPGPTNGNSKLATQLTFQGPDGQPIANEPLETGRFACEVSLDGKLEKSAVFNIEFSACPIAEIIQSTRCIGFFELNRECRRYGDSSGDAAKCTCQLSGWDCR